MSPVIETTSELNDAAVLERLLNDRWSCRSFLPTPVERDVIEQLLTLAQRSPSWCNTQPWEAIITSGAATERFRSALSQWASSHDEGYDYTAPLEYLGIYRERRRGSGWALYDAVGIAKGDREASARQGFKNFEFFDAPHVAIITADATHGTYGVLDTGIYVQTFLLAAHALGLGAIPQAALASHSALVREHFDIPADRKVVLGISFGYADVDHAANSYRTERAPLEEVVTWVNE